MATERELKLSLLPRDAGKLKNHPLLAAAPATTRQIETHYFDTGDHQLARAGVAVRLRRIEDHYSATVKTESADQSGFTERGEWVCAIPAPLAEAALAEPAELSAFPPWLEPLFERVAPRAIRDLLHHTALQLRPILSTRFRRTTWPIALVGGEAEVAFDRGVITTGTQTVPLCELEIESPTAPFPSLLEFARTLAETVALWPEPRSKAARGFALLTGDAATAFKTKPPRWSAEMSIADAFFTAWWSCVAHGGANMTLYAQHHDPEALHQLRIALRRSRTLLAHFAPWLGAPLADALRAYIASVARPLGTRRDRDVLVDAIIRPAHTACPVAQQEIACLAEVLHPPCHRAAALPYRALGQLWLDTSLRLLAAKPSSFSSDPLEPFVRTLWHRTRRRVRHRIDQWEADPTSERRHRVRIALKSWRYLLEWSRALLPKRAYRREMARVKHALDLLGAAQDWEGAQHQLAPYLRRGDRLAVGAAAVLAWHHARSVLPCETLRNDLRTWFHDSWEETTK
ncbi:MAG: CHAD domain-containing protein [Hydrogenophilus thermoluteolus]